GALTPQSVLDYFAQSPFYDPTSNNAVLRMQTQYSVAAGTAFNEAEELKRFVGIEFAVTYSEPPDLFIIEKRDRKSPTEAHPVAAYYVLHNSIYQAPDLYSVLSNRLLSSLFYLRTSLSSARDKKTDFHPRTGGNRYKVIKEQAVPDAKNADIDIEKEMQGTAEQNKDGKVKKQGFNTDFLLARALQTTVNNASQSAQ
ncbi:MED6-domain-containing protein, partial [Cystobasidium minutum MCA 4210]|uniref:MED6-domain-containing protein n=1 Tax=Cystobasidium minutum MCA 4210 TaxID=1397322 RepID=UPI0034CEFCEA